MADEKPEIQFGYLGPHEGFSELGLNTLSHEKFEIETPENFLEVRFKVPEPVKIAYQVLHCPTGYDRAEYCFAHVKGDNLVFSFQFPARGYYKFQLYAVEVSEESNELPNVFNYLIHCLKAPHPVYQVPITYVQWRNGCFLNEPMYLHNDLKLTDIKWSVHVPNAHNVAVNVDGKWYPFEKKGGDLFEAVFSLNHLRGTDPKITLNANYVHDDTKYCTLLLYKLLK